MSTVQKRLSIFAPFAGIMCAICGLAVLLAGPAAAQELVEEDTFLNVRINGRLVRLEVFFSRLKNPVETRLPVALITHGKPPSEGRMTDLRAKAYAMHARDFARRGYLAAVVMRRGFGRSDGPMPVTVSCGSVTFAGQFEADADDLEGALAVIGQRPDADMERIAAIGSSAGGAAVLTLAARNPKGLRAVVNVSGGLKIENCGKDELLVSPIAEAGARSRVKTLWAYAENDKSFPPAIVDKMHEAWLARGGDVRRVRVPAMGTDGHTIFNALAGRRIWLAEADALLRDAGLPTWTHANVQALARELKVPETQVAFVERYFLSPGEKAMARGRTSNRSNFQFGLNTLKEARERAIHACEERPPKESCEIVLENNELLLAGGRRWILGLKSGSADSGPGSSDPASTGTNGTKTGE